MKITLRVGNGDTFENVQHEISKIKIHQITKSLAVIKDIFGIVQGDESLKAAFGEFMNSVGEEEASDQSGEELMVKLMGAYETLLLNLPDKAIELLSALSGIEKDIVMAQDVEDVFDIYDAVVEENDIEKLINRAKKSLAVTKQKIRFKAIAEKATATTTQQ